MPEEIAARYAEYSTAELFELARAGESKLRPEAWQFLKRELRKRGLELTPEDEALAAGRPSDSITTDSEVSGSEPPGVRGWLAVFVVSMALNVVILTYGAVAAFVALSWMGVLYGLKDAILVIGLVLVYHRDPLAPRFWRAALILMAGFNVLLAATDLIDRSQAVLSVFALLMWAAYWTSSSRVRATFTTRSSITSGDEELEQSSDPSLLSPTDVTNGPLL